MKSRLTARDVELAVAQHVCYRRNIVVPNVSWGLGLRYEADLVILRPSGWAEEVEIKVTASDIKADLKKDHTHDSRLFRRLWFAVPAELASHPSIPAKAGIMALHATADGLQRYIVATRAPKVNELAVKWNDSKAAKLMALATMRVWTLKEALKNGDALRENMAKASIGLGER